MKSLPNLLIVDDAEVNLFLLEELIKKIKVNLIKALSGEEALEKTKGLDLALAIIDVRMPGMDGYELAVKMNSNRKEDKVPVIFLTASNINETEVFKGYSSGAVDYISKPFIPQILISKINIFLDLFIQKQNVVRDSILLKESADELKKVNSALKKSEGRLRDIMFSMADWVWEMDENGVYTYSSKRGPELLGVSHEQIIGKTPFDFMSPDEVRKAEDIFSEIMANKAAIKDYESWNIGKNGERICLLTNGVPIIDEFGNFRGYRGVDKDITERKCVEAALQESEEKYRNYIDHAPEGVFVADETGKFLEVNEAICSATEYSEDELLEMSVSDLLTEVSRYSGLKFLNNVLKTGTSKIELSFLDKHQLVHWWSLSAVKFAETSILCFTQEITRRKKMEKDLRSYQIELEMQNEELTQARNLAEAATIKYIELYNFAPTGYLTISNNYTISELNHSAAAILGKERLNLKESNFCFFVSKDFLPLFNSFIQDILYDKTRKAVEIMLETADNKRKYVHIEGRTVGNNQQIFLNVLDITERKIAENLVRESESNLAEAQRIAHIGSWEWDMISNTVKLSKEMFLVFDIDPETYDGKPETLFSVIHPDDIELFTANMDRNLALGDSYTLEYRVIHTDGSLHFIHGEGRMEIDLKGKPKRSIGTVQDITERKLAERELRQANSFLDSIIENIPDTVFIKDAKALRYLRFNRAGEELFGLTKEQILGKTDFESFLKDQAELFNKTDLEVIQAKAMIDIPDAILRTLNNEVRILHTKKVPILNEMGDPEYLLGISEDITNRKVAEQTLKVSEEKYRTMLNASPDGIFLIDFNGRITDVSEIGIELFGFDSKEELIGKHFLNFVPSEGKKTIMDIITKTMNEGIAQNVEIRIKKKSQALFLSEASSTLIQGADGKPFSFMIIIRDISFRKKMETKQIHADRMANLGEMASGIAHEINQPLNIISMVMDKILFETAKTEFIDIGFLINKADKIFDNITRIRNIIDHVRAFSRSHDDYVLTAFDLNASIENAASMIAEQFKHLGITLSLILDEQIPQIIGNTYKFEQVIVNLLTNAKDAVIEKKNRQEGFTDLLVTIQTHQENQFLFVEIADNGIGIVNEDLHNIMLPFYTTKEEGKGTGLGLSISYQIIKDMGGTIEIASNKLTGTIIKLVLNIQKGK